VFRAITKNGRVWGDGISAKVVWNVVRAAAARAEIHTLSPHDLRRTCARLCHLAGGELDQIQFLLEHVSIQTTERYLRCKQKLRVRRQRPARHRSGQRDLTRDVGGYSRTSARLAVNLRCGMAFHLRRRFVARSPFIATHSVTATRCARLRVTLRSLISQVRGVAVIAGTLVVTDGRRIRRS
jgi:hypothetical protein